MSDLAEQIRERLDELAKPPVAKLDFTDAKFTLEQRAEFEALWEEARRGPHVMTVIPLSPIDRMRAALLAVLDGDPTARQMDAIATALGIEMPNA